MSSGDKSKTSSQTDGKAAQSKKSEMGMMAYKMYVFDQENFQGRMIEISNECMNVCEMGMDRVRSLRVECGPFVGYEQMNFCGEMYILEKGEYPRWDSWSNCQKNDYLLSFRPVRMVQKEKETLEFPFFAFDCPPLTVSFFFLPGFVSLSGPREAQDLPVRGRRVQGPQDGDHGRRRSQPVLLRLHRQSGQHHCQLWNLGGIPVPRIPRKPVPAGEGRVQALQRVRRPPPPVPVREAYP
ncbi:gamma-crystallin D isoform X1 [Pungitius pungitius]|uniref:gamma-crystallin D isoform X1 n=1 Tax=Pungitius pungitius TaxID=134920 RepID=UPI001886BCF0|nr:gamma-crystallin D isoform X1 [Pungitius pungitius]